MSSTDHHRLLELLPDLEELLTSDDLPPEKSLALCQLELLEYRELVEEQRVLFLELQNFLLRMRHDLPTHRDTWRVIDSLKLDRLIDCAGKHTEKFSPGAGTLKDSVRQKALDEK